MTGPSLAAGPRALRVVKRPDPIEVAFAAADGVCETIEGPVRYHTADALLTGLHQERWPIRRALFTAAYEAVPPTIDGEDGFYRKRPSVTLAHRLDREILVPVGWQDDPLQGKPGDWLLHYADGSQGVVQDAIFRESYGPAPGETRWPPPA